MKRKSKIQEELPSFTFPVFLENPEVRDIDLDHKLPLELFLSHEGYKTTIDGDLYVVSVRNFDSHPRDTLDLKITSWRGISLNAVHYYGNIRLPVLEFIERKTGSTVMGYKIPQSLRDVELHRPLTSDELRENPDRWYAYNTGDMVPGFDTKEDVVVRGRTVAEKYFLGFKLIVSDCC